MTIIVIFISHAAEVYIWIQCINFNEIRPRSSFYFSISIGPLMLIFVSCSVNSSILISLNLLKFIKANHLRLCTSRLLLFGAPS